MTFDMVAGPALLLLGLTVAGIYALAEDRYKLLRKLPEFEKRYGESTGRRMYFLSYAVFPTVCGGMITLNAFLTPV